MKVMERPIIFTGPMVCAVLEGRKTQTRRVLTPQPLDVIKKPIKGEHPIWAVLTERNPQHGKIVRCRYGFPGDRLWVRETWVEKAWSDADCDTVGCPDAQISTEKYFGSPLRAIYKASYAYPAGAGPWKPSIHMPRWASRITLEITVVRVERVQGISLQDINAEGVSESRTPFIDHVNAKGHFADLWDSLNAKRGYGWDKNPWVWVIGFLRIPQSQGTKP